jgi:hypothetical protein
MHAASDMCEPHMRDPACGHNAACNLKRSSVRKSCSRNNNSYTYCCDK